MKSRAALLLWMVFQPAAAATIAIDVGHYTEKPGVISARGRPEFEFNLDLAREIESALKARGHATRMIGADGGRWLSGSPRPPA